MDDVSGISFIICLKLRCDAQTRQFWDEDSSFWEDPATLLAIEELTITEIEEVARHEKPMRDNPPPTNPLRDNGKRGSGKATSSSAKTITPTLSRPAQSQGIHVSCQVVT